MTRRNIVLIMVDNGTDGWFHQLAKVGRIKSADFFVPLMRGAVTTI